MHNFSAVSNTITHTPWRVLPTLFVCCTKDVAMSLDLQKTMVKDAVESGVTEPTVCTVESSHGPFRSTPAEVVRIVEDVWKSYMEGQARYWMTCVVIIVLLVKTSKSRSSSVMPAATRVCRGSLDERNVFVEILIFSVRKDDSHYRSFAASNNALC